MLCNWCSSLDYSLVFFWILWLYKMICARTSTSNEKPGSSWLLPFTSRLSKISNSQGRGDSCIKDPLNSFFTFFSSIRIALDILSIISCSVHWFKNPQYVYQYQWSFESFKPRTFSFNNFKKHVLYDVYERLYTSINAACFSSRTFAALNCSSDWCM